MAADKIFGGFAGVEMDIDTFEMGEGIILRKTYAHLFAPFMMAFKPKGKLGFNEGPWKAAKGGVNFDIRVEIEVPEISSLKDTFNQEDVIWIIAALIRISSNPYLTVPAISNKSFQQIPEAADEPYIIPYETKHRILSPSTDGKPLIPGESLEWVKDCWLDTALLMKTHPHLYSAVKAFDSATIQGNVSSSLLALWGAIEQLFSPHAGELRFRVSANLASFLKEPGSERLQIYKRLLKLYNERSSAAHTSKEITYEPLIETYIHIRNALVKIISQGKVPNQEALEELMFEQKSTNTI